MGTRPLAVPTSKDSCQRSADPGMNPYLSWGACRATVLRIPEPNAPIPVGKVAQQWLVVWAALRTEFNHKHRVRRQLACRMNLGRNLAISSGELTS